MALARILVEEFHEDVLQWLRERAEVVIVNPWLEPQRWESEAPRVDASSAARGGSRASTW